MVQLEVQLPFDVMRMRIRARVSKRPRALPRRTCAMASSASCSGRMRLASVLMTSCTPLLPLAQRAMVSDTDTRPPCSQAPALSRKVRKLLKEPAGIKWSRSAAACKDRGRYPTA